MTVADIIQKRKDLWENDRDIERDKAYVRAAVIKVLKTDSLRDEIKSKPYLLIELSFHIVNKTQTTLPFFLNEVQRDFIAQYETHGTRRPYVILKGRQQGFTSLITAIQLSYAIVCHNFSGFTVADCGSNTRTIFNDKARMVYSRLPNELKPTEKFNSINELFFEKLGSSWRVATASADVGRSKTLNFVHFSEAAFYKCTLSELQKSIGQAMTADAFCVYESTANGFNEFRDLWESGSCINLFYGWWRTEEYRSNHYEYIESADDWLRERIKLFEKMGIEREQIAWYCEKYAGYLDKATIRQEFPCTPEEAFLTSGDCIFNKEKISNRLIEAASLPYRVGYFEYDKRVVPHKDARGEVIDVEYLITNMRFIEDPNGYIRIHEDPRVKTDSQGCVVAKAPYVVGGDTADLGEDFYAAKVIDNINGVTVATLQKQRIDEELYAEQIYCLGMHYHEALIGIETNYSRHPMRVLRNKYGYKNLYMRERVDRLTDERQMILGFETTPKTKPIILSELVTLMRERPEIETDIPTLKEMLTFVKKADGRQEATAGQHDDLVMSLAITHFISKQQTHTWIPVEDDDIYDLLADFKQSSNAGYDLWS